MSVKWSLFTVCFMSVIVSHANLNMQSKVKLFASALYNYSVITKAIGTESSKKQAVCKHFGNHAVYVKNGKEEACRLLLF